MSKRDQFTHNRDKARRQREIDAQLKEERRTRCDWCDHISEPDDFACGSCGKPFDIKLVYNQYGLPDLNF